MRKKFNVKFDKKIIWVFCVISILLTSAIVSAIGNVDQEENDLNKETGTLSEDSQYIQRKTLEVRTELETGIGDTAVGDLDVFIHSVEGQLYDGISDDWKEQLGTWKSSGSYNNFLFNPAYDKDTINLYPNTDLTAGYTMRKVSMRQLVVYQL